MVHLSENVQETNVLEWKDHWIGHTRVWNSGIPLPQPVRLKFLVGGTVCTWCSSQIILNGFHCCFPQSSEVRFMCGNESPVTSFSGQEGLYSCRLWWSLKHVVYFMKFIGCTLEVWAIIRVNCFSLHKIVTQNLSYAWTPYQ